MRQGHQVGRQGLGDRSCSETRTATRAGDPAARCGPETPRGDGREAQAQLAAPAVGGAAWSAVGGAPWSAATSSAGGPGPHPAPGPRAPPHSNEPPADSRTRATSSRGHRVQSGQKGNQLSRRTWLGHCTAPVMKWGQEQRGGNSATPAYDSHCHRPRSLRLPSNLERFYHPNIYVENRVRKGAGKAPRAQPGSDGAAAHPGRPAPRPALPPASFCPGEKRRDGTVIVTWCLQWTRKWLFISITGFSFPLSPISFFT